MRSWTIERSMTARIALFRARKDAASSAARLRRFGFSVAQLPVIEIAPLPFATAKTRYDAIVATSAKAFLSEAPVDRASPLFVVGARTAREGEARGWRLAAPPAPDAERLVETLERLTKPGASLLYLAGRDRKHALEAALGATRALEVVEAYAAEARTGWRPAEARALASCAFALHYSPRSAALAVRLAEAAGLSGRFAAMTHVCLSAEVAGPLEEIGAAHVLVAERPDEPALLAALSHAARLFPSDRPYRI
jgi:uroporphyrinogen-III synthase